MSDRVILRTGLEETPAEPFVWSSGDYVYLPNKQPPIIRQIIDRIKRKPQKTHRVYLRTFNGGVIEVNEPLTGIIHAVTFFN